MAEMTDAGRGAGPQQERQHAEGSTSPADPISNQARLLQLLVKEFVALRQEVSDIRPELKNVSGTLASLEAYILVSFRGRMAEILKAEVATAFEEQRKRTSRARWIRRVAVWIIVLLTLALLLAEMQGDAVSQWVQSPSGAIGLG